MNLIIQNLLMFMMHMIMIVVVSVVAKVAIMDMDMKKILEYEKINIIYIIYFLTNIYQ